MNTNEVDFAVSNILGTYSNKFVLKTFWADQNFIESI